VLLEAITTVPLSWRIETVIEVLNIPEVTQRAPDARRYHKSAPFPFGAAFFCWSILRFWTFLAIWLIGN
jgi:hypothetical protein